MVRSLPSYHVKNLRIFTKRILKPVIKILNVIYMYFILLSSIIKSIFKKMSTHVIIAVEL